MNKYTTTVREGEKLSDIANRFTGNPNAWPMIVDLNTHLPRVAVRHGNNTIVTLASLTTGQKLFIPNGWVINSGVVSGTVGGCSSCGSGSKCNSCGGGCEYPYGNRNSQSAPCGAFGNDLGSCGRMRTGAYLTGTVGADPTKTNGTPNSIVDEAKRIASQSPEQCVKDVEKFYPYIEQSEIYPELVSRFGSKEEVKARYGIVAQTACNIERKDINVQSFYSKPTNWLWMGGALIAGVIVGKVIL